MAPTSRAATEVGIPTIGQYTDHFQMVGIFKIDIRNIYCNILGQKTEMYSRFEEALVQYVGLQLTTGYSLGVEVGEEGGHSPPPLGPVAHR